MRRRRMAEEWIRSNAEGMEKISRVELGTIKWINGRQRVVQQADPSRMGRC
jgi:uncharacterized protein YlzI (FlbEa/FlbD family)